MTSDMVRLHRAGFSVSASVFGVSIGGERILLILLLPIIIRDQMIGGLVVVLSVCVVA